VSTYRFRRRAFLASVAGAVGLETLLGNLEASAQGVALPRRLLVLHWPLGTIQYLFTPQGSGTAYVTSPILQPFETAGLREEMIVLNGLRFDPSITGGGGGGHEGGTVMMVTGARSPGTRSNQGEADDACAGGPSFDQIFLKHSPLLRQPGAGFVTALADARVESNETSTVCLSYSYQQRSISAANPMGGTLVENVPILPVLAPERLYASLFSSLVPGANGNEKTNAALRALKLKKSVLDSSLRELARLKTLAPASEAPRIEAHAAAVRRLEIELGEKLALGEAECRTPEKPDATLSAPRGSGLFISNPSTAMGEEEQHAQIGKAHLSVIRAALQCDLIRVATFQWAPGQSHVAFANMYDPEPGVAHRHHPLSHRNHSSTQKEPTDQQAAHLFTFLSRVQTWYNQRFAEFLNDLKATRDIYGESLLDTTIVPCMTEVADNSHGRSPIPALIFGGRKLGMQGGQYQRVERSHTDLWLTLAQAFFPDAASPLDVLGGETFAQVQASYQGPIPGLWRQP